MGKYNPDQLLALAFRFEKLAQTDPFGLPSDSFIRQIRSLTGVNPKPEEWKAWLEANRTVLGGLADRRWEFNDQRSSYSVVETYPDEKVAYISLDPDLPYPEFVRKAFAMLKATPPLPPLWLQIGRTEYESRPSVPVELGHYAWLAEGINQILGTSSKEDLIKFLANNRLKIDRVRRSFETQQPKYLGGGADGAAFDIGGGKVLKIFRDDISYEKARLAFDRLHKSPSLAKTEAMIYDVGELGRFGGYPDDPTSGRMVYYYIIEMMKPIRELFGGAWNTPISRILTSIAEHIKGIKDSKLRALKKAIQDPEKADLIRKVVKEESLKIAEDIRRDYSLKHDVVEAGRVIPNLKSNWLELYVEEVIMKYLTGRTDLHQGNLGVTGYGELRYYDPAYGGHESEINI